MLFVVRDVNQGWKTIGFRNVALDRRIEACQPVIVHCHHTNLKRCTIVSGILKQQALFSFGQIFPCCCCSQNSPYIPPEKPKGCSFVIAHTLMTGPVKKNNDKKDETEIENRKSIQPVLTVKNE